MYCDNAAHPFRRFHWKMTGTPCVCDSQVAGARPFFALCNGCLRRAVHYCLVTLVMCGSSMNTRLCLSSASCTIALYRTPCLPSLSPLPSSVLRWKTSLLEPLHSRLALCNPVKLGCGASHQLEGMLVIAIIIFCLLIHGLRIPVPPQRRASEHVDSTALERPAQGPDSPAATPAPDSGAHGSFDRPPLLRVPLTLFRLTIIVLTIGLVIWKLVLALSGSNLAVNVIDFILGAVLGLG
jgi:hypothetical protein